jgi:hypothetical protein
MIVSHSIEKHNRDLNPAETRDVTDAYLKEMAKVGEKDVFCLLFLKRMMHNFPISASISYHKLGLKIAQTYTLIVKDAEVHNQFYWVQVKVAPF